MSGDTETSALQLALDFQRLEGENLEQKLPGSVCNAPQSLSKIYNAKHSKTNEAGQIIIIIIIIITIIVLHYRNLTNT